jgi:hypothetical protein
MRTEHFGTRSAKGRGMTTRHTTPYHPMPAVPLRRCKRADCQTITVYKKCPCGRNTHRLSDGETAAYLRDGFEGLVQYRQAERI